jgi:hypothetical protein
MRISLLAGLTTDLVAFEGEDCYLDGDIDMRLGFAGRITEESSPSFKKASRFSIFAFLMRKRYKALTLRSPSSLDEDVPSR